MLNFDRMDVDLSIVKKERLELDDYGQNAGNILDNFISESDYSDFGQTVPTVPCGEEDDVNVDWLSSFFDEPIHDNMTGLNPPLTDISTTHCTPSISNITSINGSTENLTLDSYSTFTENYITGISCSDTTLKRPSSPESPPLRKSNPFLSQTKTQSNTKDTQKTDLKIKLEESSKNTEMDVDRHFVKTQKQNQQKLLLFMNTPENRAKLAGTNFNIINASLLSKLSSQAQKNEKTMNVISLKKPADNNVKQESGDSTSTVSIDDKSNEESSTTLLKSIQPNGISGILQNNVFQGLLKKDKEQCQEIDSGYESPTSSSGSSPASPPTNLERRGDNCNSCDTIQYIDVPPHERQPFYLSEEEKRTLIMEGLPVPTGLPLNKMEERALKKVRRKIKNKISAQESRRKKKEYMEALEKKVDNYAADNNGLKKKIASLEMANRSLIIQVQKLQGLVASKVGKNVTSSTKYCQTEDGAL